MPFQHSENVIERLLPRQLPIFCEKPLTADVEQAQRLAQQAANQVFVMDKWRYHPAIEALRSLLEEQRLGKPLFLISRRLQLGLPHSDIDWTWRVLPHDLAVVLHLLGDLPVPRAAGEWFKNRLEGVTAILGGTVPTVVEVSSRQPICPRTVNLVCEEGTAMMHDPYADHIRIYRETSLGNRQHVPETLPISTEMPLLRELRHFCEYLRGGPPPLSNVVIGAQVVETIVKIRALAEL